VARVHFIFGQALHKLESLPGITGFGRKMPVFGQFLLGSKVVH
jgi:hypothetical protein